MALLGDSLLKTAVLTELGVGKDTRSELALITAGPGEITSRASQVLSNQTLSNLAETILLVPSVNIKISDIELMPVHGRATCVEAAVALVSQADGGPDAVRALARFILMSPLATPAIANPKGVLLDFGGRVESRAGECGGFIANAWLPGIAEPGIEGGEWPSRSAAEAAASEAALTFAGMASQEARVAARRAAGVAALELASRQAGAQVQATWHLQREILFNPITVTAAALTGASQKDGASWLIRGLVKRGDAFQRLMGAPLALPMHFTAVHGWMATVRSPADGEDGRDEKNNMFLAILGVSRTDGTQRWFISPGASETQSKVRESVGTLAAHSLGLLDLAIAAESTHE